MDQEQEESLSLLRYSKLLKSYSAAFDAMKKECSFEKFKVAFPMLARDNPDFLEEKREDMFRKFKETTYVCLIAEFLEVVKDQDLKVLLSELDKIAAQTDGSDVAMESEDLVPEQVVSAHQYAVKLAEANRLKSMLAKEKEENELLMKQVQLEMEQLKESVNQGTILMSGVVSSSASSAA